MRGLGRRTRLQRARADHRHRHHRHRLGLWRVAHADHAEGHVGQPPRRLDPHLEADAAVVRLLRPELLEDRLHVRAEREDPEHLDAQRHLGPRDDARRARFVAPGADQQAEGRIELHLADAHRALRRRSHREPHAARAAAGRHLQAERNRHARLQAEQRLVDCEGEPAVLVGQLPDREHARLISGEDGAGQAPQPLGERAVGLQQLGQLEIHADQRAPAVGLQVDLDRADADRRAASEGEHLGRHQQPRLRVAAVQEDERAQDHRLGHRQAEVGADAGRLRALLHLPAAAALAAVAAHRHRARRAVLLVPVEQPHLLRPTAGRRQVRRHAAGDQHANAAQLEACRPGSTTAAGRTASR